MLNSRITTTTMLDASPGSTGFQGTCDLTAGEHLVEHLRGLLVIDVQHEYYLRKEDLARLVEHALLAGRKTLLMLADREVPNDLGHLVDVATPDLVTVFLVAVVPVGGHLALF